MDKILPGISNIRGSRERGLAIDLAVYAALLSLGVAYFRYYLKTPDLTLDATYFELARSIVEKGAYVFDFRTETMFPPGFPTILALVYRLTGVSVPVAYHVAAVVAVLGLLATYELLRRVENRAVAVAICLVLATSPSLFSFVTSMIFAEMPYFFFSMAALLLALKIDQPKPLKAQAGWILLLGVTLVLAVMTRSVGIALLGGLFLWIAVSVFTNRQLVRARIIKFFIPLLLALVVQGLWSGWAKQRQVEQWSIGGWPHSYMSQLLLKDGNDPELGRATLGDIPGRIATNLTHRAAEVSQLLFRRETATHFWSSPVIIGLILLIGIGLATSLWKGGGQPHDWYFLCHEAIFLVWPWGTETRFVLPVVPLAWLYLWRGGKVMKTLLDRRTRVAAIGLAFLGTFLAFESAEVAIHASAKRWEPLLASLFWGLIAFIGFGILALRNFSRRTGSEPAGHWLDTFQARLAPALRVTLIVMLAALIGYGALLEFEVARGNAHPDLTQGPWYPDIEAAEWIQSHTPPDQVVMALKQDLVFHYTGHKVVWFPPISDPKQLMDGIRRHHINLVVVVTAHKYSSWQPSEEVCFTSLLKAYPSSFRVLHSGPNYWIYEVGLLQS